VSCVESTSKGDSIVGAPCVVSVVTAAGDVVVVVVVVVVSVGLGLATCADPVLSSSVSAAADAK
jgi:hypothetical protein